MDQICSRYLVSIRLFIVEWSENPWQVLFVLGIAILFVTGF